jgi:hypothetical protein
MDKLEKEIEEIRRMLFKSTEKTFSNRWKLVRGD